MSRATVDAEQEVKVAHMDYLGNKTALADEIVQVLRPHLFPGARVADLFAGTGSVAVALARAGFNVDANDLLPLSVTCTQARLLGAGATFAGLKGELGPLGPDPQTRVHDALAALPGIEGWITRNYSPRSRETVGIERRYLTEANARRVDAVRHQLRVWRPSLTPSEQALLMCSLVEAVSDVSNVAGTYGCYLKQWKASAERPLRMHPYRDIAPAASHVVTGRDAQDAAAESDADALYADPPYTKRQYAAYYHLLNSIVTDKEPELTGSTGLPDWRPLSSEWCYKQRAPQALERLVAKSATPVLALSYSSDGHIGDDTIRDILGTHGTVSVHEFERRRYRSSSLAHKGASVIERVYVMQR